jgi:glutaminyl-tRNA synthetase
MEEATRPGNFIRTIVDNDRKAGKNGGQVVTRFPPEPNGYLHIGHAKSICLNFGLARDYAGRCHLRFDDTNPAAEDVEYVDSIMADVRWLGFDWGEHLHYASDYFEQLYQWAEQLVKAGKAFVCDLTPEQQREYRGTLVQPGKNSPFRDRSIEENLDLFRRMRAGEFADGAKVLRAKIDMASPNLNLRDPIMYRIKRFHHHRTGDAWCLYPMYDWAHGLSDAIEGITHSICTLEFEAHRPLYDWFIDQLPGVHHPQQIEFARLNLDYTVLSKRMLIELVTGKFVAGWDDPRMPTIAGFRRRGYTPESIRDFAERIGVAKADSVVDTGMLEACIREDLNTKAPRVACVHDPVKVVIENWPEGKVEELDAPFFPDDPPKMGSRKVPFSRELYIEREDFMEAPPKGYYRLAPGREVRLRFAYVIKCNEVIKDASGKVVELRCSYDPDPNPARKIGGTIHWVSAAHAKKVEVRLYDRLFTVPAPAGDKEKNFKEFLNPSSLVVLKDAVVEPSMANAKPGDRVQFERKGYYYVDPIDSKPGAPVFSRIVPLRDSWAKQAKGGK